MIKTYLAWLSVALLALSFSATASSANNLQQQNVQQQNVQQENVQQENTERVVPLILLPPSIVDTESEVEEEPGAVDADASNELVDNYVELAEQEISSGSFVIYVVRHAEKEETQLDPGLTAEGAHRAEGLAQMLSEAGVERIYSTIYRRNAATALPLARTLNLPVEFYQAEQGDALVTQLLEQSQSALVVGHSNTVAGLINALGGAADELSEDRYGDVFQLLVQRDGDNVNVHQLHLTAPMLMSERRTQR